MKDDMILRRLRRGDPRALEALMEKYIPYVSAVVWGILRHRMQPEDGEEVASDVFLAAWNQAQDIDPKSLKAWLGAVARNKARNRLRQAGFTLPLEEDVLELPAEATPYSVVRRAEERRLVRQAVDSLGEPDREVFLRHYYHAQTVQEIGRAMGMNESTVKTKLRRGRLRLKDLLERWGI